MQNAVKNDNICTIRVSYLIEMHMCFISQFSLKCNKMINRVIAQIPLRNTEEAEKPQSTCFNGGGILPQSNVWMIIAGFCLSFALYT